MSSQELSKILRKLADPVIAGHSRRFFKTGKGEYGEGDTFLGIRVPVLRQQAKKHKDISLKETLRLLKSVYHEERLCVLFILTHQFEKANKQHRTVIYKLYLANTQYINNWDLVDASAHKIVGAYLENKSRQPLYKLCKSKNLWERRIAIIATFWFIKLNQFDDTLEISKQLINDKEDLIHKAVGWMLREVGNRDIAFEREFLKTHYKNMPRTMLRYAIEKFPKRERKKFLSGTI